MLRLHRVAIVLTGSAAGIIGLLLLSPGADHHSKPASGPERFSEQGVIQGVEGDWINGGSGSETRPPRQSLIVSGAERHVLEVYSAAEVPLARTKVLYPAGEEPAIQTKGGSRLHGVRYGATRIEITGAVESVEVQAGSHTATRIYRDASGEWPNEVELQPELWIQVVPAALARQIVDVSIDARLTGPDLDEASRATSFVMGEDALQIVSSRSTLRALGLSDDLYLGLHVPGLGRSYIHLELGTMNKYVVDLREHGVEAFSRTMDLTVDLSRFVEGEHAEDNLAGAMVSAYLSESSLFPASALAPIFPFARGKIGARVDGSKAVFDDLLEGEEYLVLVGCPASARSGYSRIRPGQKGAFVPAVYSLKIVGAVNLANHTPNLTRREVLWEVRVRSNDEQGPRDGALLASGSIPGSGNDIAPFEVDPCLELSALRVRKLEEMNHQISVSLSLSTGGSQGPWIVLEASALDSVVDVGLVELEAAHPLESIHVFGGEEQQWIQMEGGEVMWWTGEEVAKRRISMVERSREVEPHYWQVLVGEGENQLPDVTTGQEASMIIVSPGEVPNGFRLSYYLEARGTRSWRIVETESNELVAPVGDAKESGAVAIWVGWRDIPVLIGTVPMVPGQAREIFAPPGSELRWGSLRESLGVPRWEACTRLQRDGGWPVLK